MKYIVLTLLSLTTTAGFAQQRKKTNSTRKTTFTQTVKKEGLSSKADSVSYAFGQDIGKSLKNLNINYLNADVIAKGIAKALKGESSLLTEEKGSQIIQDAIMEVRAQKDAAARVNEQAFFTKNAAVDGMQTTTEGIQYKIINSGSGAKPLPTDEVTVHYRGTLLDGTQFDSSYDRNEPLTLTLDRVIKGWKLGIPLMPKGAKYTFFIPSTLGYGAQATGKIPANSTLVFDVELLDFKTNEEK